MKAANILFFNSLCCKHKQLLTLKNTRDYQKICSSHRIAESLLKINLEITIFLGPEKKNQSLYNETKRYTTDANRGDLLMVRYDFCVYQNVLLHFKDTFCSVASSNDKLENVTINN
jgi:hypothetical protein